MRLRISCIARSRIRRRVRAVRPMRAIDGDMRRWPGPMRNGWRGAVVPVMSAIARRASSSDARHRATHVIARRASSRDEHLRVARTIERRIRSSGICARPRDSVDRRVSSSGAFDRAGRAINRVLASLGVCHRARASVDRRTAPRLPRSRSVRPLQSSPGGVSRSSRRQGRGRRARSASADGRHRCPASLGTSRASP